MTTFNPLMSRFASPFGRGGYESTPTTLMDYLAEVRGAPPYYDLADGEARCNVRAII